MVAGWHAQSHPCPKCGRVTLGHCDIWCERCLSDQKVSNLATLMASQEIEKLWSSIHVHIGLMSDVLIRREETQRRCDDLASAKKVASEKHEPSDGIDKTITEDVLESHPIIHDGEHRL